MNGQDFEVGDRVLIKNYYYNEFVGLTGIIVQVKDKLNTVGVDFGVNPFKDVYSSQYNLLWQLTDERNNFLLKYRTGRYFHNLNLQKIDPIDVGDLEDDF